MSGEKPEGKSDPGLKGEVEKLKSDMEKVTSELRSEIEGLKNALIELKSSLSEIENPFNLLSSLVDEESLRKISGMVQSKPPEKEVEKTEEHKVEKSPERELQLRSVVIQEADYNKSIALIKWVWTLLELGFDVDDIERLSRYCEFFSLLPRGSSHYISAVASAVEKARALNLSEDIMALSIYGAAKASGLRIELEDITDIVFNALRKLISKSPEMNLQR